MAAMTRRVFFVSDRTGITAETLGESLLTQFPDQQFLRTNLPFIGTAEKAQIALKRINDVVAVGGERPLVFSTLTDPQTQAVIAGADAWVFDLFGTYIEPLEKALGKASSHTAGRMHGMTDLGRYQHRVNALNFTLDHDDGLRLRELDQADVILVGVSRSGKTPTCLYLAMHFHLKAANYPLDDDDLDSDQLPEKLRAHKRKIFALTIQPEHLSRIRHERRPDSNYASLAQCRAEIARAVAIFDNEQIPCIDTTTTSIEEIATTVLEHFGFERARH